MLSGGRRVVAAMPESIATVTTTKYGGLDSEYTGGAGVQHQVAVDGR
jgi:hypothetical protein